MTIEVALAHRFEGMALDIAFTAPARGVTTLFGPSGAGKSTVLAALAGLLRPRRLRLALGDTVLADDATGVWVPPERRRVGMVFQDSRLFPHLTVAGNLAYGARRVARGPIREADVVALLGIGALRDRRPATLSGGERQRVAIGRALLAQPRLLLMDEPLASLDAERKADILPYLSRLKAEFDLPIVYVTHSLEEMSRLADHVVLLDQGRVVDEGPLGALSARADLALAWRDDAASVLSARVEAHLPDRRLTRLDVGGAALLVPLVGAGLGATVRVRVPAREVILARAAPAAISVQNVLPGHVRALRDDAARHTVMVEVSVGGQAILARVTPDAASRLELAPGSDVFALFKSVGVEVSAA